MPDAMALRMRDELIAARDRTRRAVLASASELADVDDGMIRDGNRDEVEAQEAQVLACAEDLANRVALWRAADEAVEAARPPRGSYRNARGIITPVVDELPEVTIRRMRDGDQP